MTSPESPQGQERRFNAEKDTELSAPLERILGHLGLVDAMATIEPDMVDPDHVDSLWADWAQPQPKPEWPPYERGEG